MDDYLMHHGVKGMKWGVRRYQNEDGTWTAEGKIRRRSKVEYIKPEKMRRINDSNESKKYTKPLYISTNNKDFNNYVYLSKNLPGVKQSTNKDNISVTSFDLKKDSLKTANRNAVNQYILDNFKRNDWYISPEDAKNNPRLKAQTFAEKYYNLMLDESDRYANDYGQKGASSLIWDVSSKMTQEQKNDLFNHFKDRGYDAIYDPEDSNYIDNSEHVFNQPLVILDPKNSIQTAGRKYINMKEWDEYMDIVVDSLD